MVTTEVPPVKSTENGRSNSGGAAGGYSDAAAPAVQQEVYRRAMLAYGDVAAALSESRDLDGLLHLIAERICELVGVNRCSLYLRDGRSGLFRGRVGHAEHNIDDGVKSLVAGGPADGFTREIIATGKPVLLSNARDDPRPIRSTMRAWDVRSMLGVPMVLRDEVIGIIFLDQKGDRTAFTPLALEIGSTFANLAAVAITQAKANAETRSSLHTTAAQNNLLRRAVTMDDRLSELALAGASIGQTAAAVSELSGRAVAVYDTTHQRRELTLPPSAADTLLPNLLPSRFHEHALIREALEAADDAKPSIIGPFPDAGMLHRFLVAPVMLRNVLWGRVVLAEGSRRFGALDKHIVRRAASNMALELTAERRASASEWDGRASLASDLLRGDRDPEALRKRADFFGVDLRSRHLVCIVAASTFDGRQPGISAPDLADALAQIGEPTPVLTTNVTEGIAAIMRLGDEGSTLQAVEGARTRIEAAIDRLSPEQPLLMALSTAGPDAVACARGYDEARQVLKCMQTFASSEAPRVLTADELGAGRVFIASVDRAEANRFAEQTLAGLLAKQGTGSDLLGTLQTFFVCSRSIRKSAEALGTHENTIRYRLSRVTEETGLNVATDSHDQLTAQMALLVLQLQGRCPWQRRA
jgi:sugar diacid utilization regulator